jgi:hypothetical protein
MSLGDLDCLVHMKVATHMAQDDARLRYRLSGERNLQWRGQRFVTTVKEHRCLMLRGAPDDAQ